MQDVIIIFTLLLHFPILISMRFIFKKHYYFFSYYKTSSSLIFTSPNNTSAKIITSSHCHYDVYSCVIHCKAKSKIAEKVSKTHCVCGKKKNKCIKTKNYLINLPTELFACKKRLVVVAYTQLLTRMFKPFLQSPVL